MSDDPAKHASSQAQALRLLMVGDDLKRLREYLGALAHSETPFRARIAFSHDDLVRELREARPDIVLADDGLTGNSWTEALPLIHAICPDIPLIVVTETPSEEVRAECLRRGATGCLAKDDLVRLPMFLRRPQREMHGGETHTGALEDLRETEARYRRLVDHATFGICAVALDGEILRANPALARMLGYQSAEELLAARDFASLYCDPGAWDELLATNGQKVRTDAAADWRRKDGGAVTVRVTSWRARDVNRANEYLEMMVEDITELFGLERQLIQAQKFEAIGQLAGGIAHDFSNLIGAILGWADLGMEETEPDSRLRRHFQKVRHQADRAAALTRQLLSFARRQVPEPRDVDLNQAVIETLSLLEKVIPANVRIIANLSPYLAVVRADPVQIEQVVMNLSINARDAMPDGGSLVVETCNVSFGEKDCASRSWVHAGDYAMISVSDSGTGMDADTLEHIFEPFFTTKELGKGTGLGLATVYGIVRQHGGFVHAESKLGAGTTIRAYFPARTSAEPGNASEFAAVRISAATSAGTDDSS